ncbi:MAG: acyltransferase [Cytophagales bacterium]|nr:MAG: acyltransferase [Cytophagales bacterium]
MDTRKDMIGNKYLPQLNIIRGSAALMVCFFHLACGNSEYLNQNNYLDKISSYGYVGLDMFFVLSGFVICWSMPQNYSYKDIFTFFKKRVIRIEPTYIISIILGLIIFSASAWVRHVDFEFSWKNILGHIAYLNNFNGQKYLNVVYWTLGIEFQFYILIGLFWGIIIKNKFSIYLFLLLFNGFIFIDLSSLNLIHKFAPLFSLGIALCLYFKKNITLNELIFIIFILSILTYFYSGWLISLIGILTSITISTLNCSNSIFDFFAKISFSLYLIHVPIGGSLINLSTRFLNDELYRTFFVLFAIVFCVGFSVIFYQFFEKPFIALSKKIKYP